MEKKLSKIEKTRKNIKKLIKKSALTLAVIIITLICFSFLSDNDDSIKINDLSFLFPLENIKKQDSNRKEKNNNNSNGNSFRIKLFLYVFVVAGIFFLLNIFSDEPNIENSLNNKEDV